MSRLFLLHCAVFLTIAPTAAANDIAEACREFATADVIFVGRVKSAPITRRISGEEEIEKARAVSDAAERELKAFEALKMPPEIGWRRHKELTIQAIEAHEEYDRTRSMYPPPVDLSLTPILVEVPFRGTTTAELFMVNMGQPDLDPARSYLFYAERPMGALAPDVISAVQPKNVESAEADLRFLHDAVANTSGTVVHGSLMLEDLSGTGASPLGGVTLRVSLDGQRYETSTDANGTFLLTGVPHGLLRIEPVLPEHLTLPPQSTGGQARGGCLEVHLRARVNARIRGRVLLDTGAPFRGFVDVVGDDPKLRGFTLSPKLTNDRGEFEFSALRPGRYLVGVNIARQPNTSAPFRPTYFPGTTDRSLATPVIVGLGMEHAEVEWVVSSRLGEGSIDVSFDTHGQPQKERGVCVTMFDADLRNNGGGGYGPGPNGIVTVPVVEGVRYRIAAHAQLPTGFAGSEIVDLIGAAGHQVLRLQLASVSQTATGHPCPWTDKPFSPFR